MYPCVLIHHELFIQFIHIDTDIDVEEESEETKDIDIKRAEDVPDSKKAKVEDQLQRAENGKLLILCLGVCLTWCRIGKPNVFLFFL